MDDIDDMDDLDLERKLCDFCGKDFEATYLKRHQSRKHGLRGRRIRKISCPLCGDTNFTFRLHLRTHMYTNHNIKIAENSFNKNNWDEFLIWLQNEENSKKIRFCKLRAPKTLENGSQRFNYYCHYNNSGNRKILPQEERQRALKHVGSCKMTGCCPAEIIVTKYSTGDVRVQYYSTHVGHDAALAHFGISREFKQDLAEKIEAGVSFDKILNDIRDNVHAGRLKKDHLISRKTLHNIAASISTSTNWKLDDNHPVCLWVRSMEKLDYNPVCLFKKHGEGHPLLKKNDFLLIIVTKIQAEVLKEFGNRIICVDSTRGPRQYALSLTTILAMDDRDCFPGGFLISNRIDETMLEVFFSEVCSKIDTVLSPVVFMSDDHPAFFKAWKRVMNPEIPPKRLLCLWNIEKNWRQALNKISGEKGVVKEKRVSVYQMLHALLEEPDQIRFLELLGLVITDLMTNKSTRRFGRYFKRKYVNRFSMWAPSFYADAGDTMNVIIENFHSSIQEICTSLMIQQLDVCIDSLLKIIRDYYFERIMKLASVKTPFVIRKLDATHKRSTVVPDDDVEENGSYFFVKSQIDREAVYAVEKMYDSCPYDCSLICRQCDACVHLYQCSCVDFIFGCNMCKHVHKVCHFLKTSNFSCSTLTSTLTPYTEVDESVNDEMENLCNASWDSQQEYNKAVKELHDSIKSLVKVKNEIHCSVPALQMAKRKIDEIVSLLSIKSEETSHLPTPKRLCPNNRNTEKLALNGSSIGEIDLQEADVL